MPGLQCTNDWIAIAQENTFADTCAMLHQRSSNGISTNTIGSVSTETIRQMSAAGCKAPAWHAACSMFSESTTDDVQGRQVFRCAGQAGVQMCRQAGFRADCLNYSPGSHRLCRPRFRPMSGRRKAAPSVAQNRKCPVGTRSAHQNAFQGALERRSPAVGALLLPPLPEGSGVLPASGQTG